MQVIGNEVDMPFCIQHIDQCIKGNIGMPHMATPDLMQKIYLLQGLYFINILLEKAIEEVQEDLKKDVTQDISFETPLEGTLALESVREGISKIKEEWRPLIEEMRASGKYPLYERFQQDRMGAHYEPISQGISGSYYLMQKGDRRYVVKPMDEEALCLNSQEWVSLDPPEGARAWFSRLPRYQTQSREALMSDMAKLMGIGDVVPESVVEIITSSAFFDISDNWSENRREEAIKMGLGPDKEKLCSVIEYCPGHDALYEKLAYWRQKQMSEKAIAALIDQRDVEKVSTLMWTSFEQDGHAGNILIYQKENGLYGLKKIDHGYSFPEENRGLRNHLAMLANNQEKLSEEGKKTIMEIPVEEIRGRMRELKMSEAAIKAFEKRISFLQQIVQEGDHTLKEIDVRMRGMPL